MIVALLLLSFIVGFILGRLVAPPGMSLGSVIIVSAICGLIVGLLF